MGHLSKSMEIYIWKSMKINGKLWEIYGKQGWDDKQHRESVAP